MRNSKIIQLPPLKNSLMLLSMLVFLTCCGQSRKEDAPDAKIKGSIVSKPAAGFNHQRVPQKLLTLAAEEQEVSSSKESLPAENLYGKFFNDRAEFYIVKEPQNKVYHSKVASLTFYYLDGQLSQTRYILEQDIVEELLRRYGSFRITGYDPKNQALISAKQVMVHTADGVLFNKELDNYGLSWQLDEKQIRYRVNKGDPKAGFHYVERMNTYKKEFSKIERAGS
jgi:hypothetical protein